MFKYLEINKKYYAIQVVPTVLQSSQVYDHFHIYTKHAVALRTPFT